MTTTKRTTSFLMALVMLLSILAGIVPVYAAEQIGEVYQVTYPRGGGYGDSWGHGQLNLMGDWISGGTHAFTTRSMDSYTGQLLYCIEPGVSSATGNQLTSKDEHFWENYPDNLNPTIDPETIKSYIGRILQYGYIGNNSTQWDVINNAYDQNIIAEIYATQALIWETVVGERDEFFEHVDPSEYGKDAVMGIVQINHPLRSLIYSHYNRIEGAVQSHDVIPSFMSHSQSQARSYEMEWDGSRYVLELRDSNGVLADYDVSSATSGFSISQSGNILTITADNAPAGSVLISAIKSSSRMGVVVWTDGTSSNQNNGQVQDLVTWGERVSDPVYAYMKLEANCGKVKIVKHSEDGVVGGIQFHISGNGIDKTITTHSDGTIFIPDLVPGEYLVSEIMTDQYEPQEPQTVTVVSGRTTTVTFSNTLKRGNLEVTKSAEDGLVQGVTFHLYGTSLSGLAVDEYAVTDASGTAYFNDVLISGDTPYTLEEVDTAIQYVIPEDQSAPILWNEVTERSFENILKKFRVEVVKQDVETGSPQGDASLAGAQYGLYKGNELVATYITDASSGFITDCFVCDTDWTLREIFPSEGYLLNETVYEIPADAAHFTIELNEIDLNVDEQVIKGNIRLVKHIDKPNPDVVTDETTPELAPESEKPPVVVKPVPGEDEQESAKLVRTEVSIAETDQSFGDCDTATEAAKNAGSTADDLVPEPKPNSVTSHAAEPDRDEYVEVPTDKIKPSGGEGVIEQPEENAKFQIYLASAGSFDNAKESERDILVTDSDGFAYSKDLPYGRYCVHQIEGMEGQAFVPDFTVFICEDGETYSYILNNQTTSSFIRIEKRDAESMELIPASNIGFQVRDLSTGEIISQTIYYPEPVTITAFYTNDEGWLMLPYELDYGQYELIEVQTCYGYVLDSEPVPFTVDGTQDVVTVEKYNFAQKGVIKLRKTGEVFASVSENEGVYQPIYEVQGIEGAVFTITALENVVTLDGTVRYTAGQVVDTITTGYDGWAQSIPLYLGKYEITETSVPEPLVLAQESVTVELTYAGQNVELTEVSTGVYNQRQKVEISLEKVLQQDPVFGIGQNNELAGVSFGLYAAEDLTAADGSTIPAGALLEIVSVGLDGMARCNTDLPLGSYYMQERATNNHYILDDTKYPVNFTYAGPKNYIVKIKVNNGEAIENKLIYGSVSGKKSGEDGNGLGGAVIGLFAFDDGSFTEESAILTTTSAEDGSFRFDNVPRGTWYLRELRQPEGFLLCEEIFPVIVEMHEQVIEISITNEKIRGNLSLTKVDAEYPDNKLIGAEFEVYRDTNGNKELDKDDELLGLMTETEPGFYEMRDIAYGGVLIREKKAPEGFYLDEGVYYVDIRSDGETYVVENEAGRGFTNEAHRGNLKIIKTSSDGVVKGFTFRITGKDYDRTFTTDDSGVIFIENLRVQEYTVTELEDELSSNYKRPDPVKVTLVIGETLTVNVHNQKVTVDVPKTGDDSNMWLWIGLMGLGVIGIGAAFAAPQLRKKKLGIRSKMK